MNLFLLSTFLFCSRVGYGSKLDRSRSLRALGDPHCLPKCPHFFSKPRPGVACIQSHDDCECIEGYMLSPYGSHKCVRGPCDFTCPTNSRPLGPGWCTQTMDDCVCLDGFVRHSDQCTVLPPGSTSSFNSGCGTPGNAIKEMGASCSYHDQCKSGRCASVEGLLLCLPFEMFGMRCTQDHDCFSKNCVNKRCSATIQEINQLCVDDQDCQTGRCEFDSNIGDQVCKRRLQEGKVSVSS